MLDILNYGTLECLSMFYICYIKQISNTDHFNFVNLKTLFKYMISYTSCHVI